MNLTIHTGNKEFAKYPLRVGYNGPTIQVRHDPAMRDNMWAVFDGDDLVSGPHDFGEDPTGSMIRKTLEKLLPKKPSLTVVPSKQIMPKAETGPAPAASILTLESVTAKIMGLQGKTIENFVEIGRWLIEAKRLVGHGNWLEYLENTIDMGERNAQLYMHLYQTAGSNPQTYADLTISKIALLLEAPTDARDSLIEIARNSTTRVLRDAVRDANRKLPVVSEVAEALAYGTQVDTSALTASAKPATRVEFETSSIETSSPEAEPKSAQSAPEAPPPEVPAAKVESAPPPQPLPKRTTHPKPAAPVLSAEEKQTILLRERALAVNLAIIALHDAVARNRGVIETADARSCGDYLDLNGLYETKDLLTEMVAQLQRIAADCNRSTRR